MIIQNNTFTGKSKITRIVTLLLVISACVIVSFWNTTMFEFKIKHEISWSIKLMFIFLFLGIYGFMLWKKYKMNYNFVYFTDEDKQNIIFRFYHIKTFGKKYTTYKIPFSAFKKYEIVEDEVKRELVLYQLVQNNKIAKYPGISITALSQQELIEIITTLDTYLPKQ